MLEIMPIRRSVKRSISKASWRTYNLYRIGMNFRSQLSEVESLFNASRETILSYQRERLTQLIRHADQTTSYYRDVFRNIGLKHYELEKHINEYDIDISMIPPLEKQTIREHLEDFCSELFQHSQRIKNATGGSTGTPLTFYQDRNYWNQRNLSVYFFDGWSGWCFGDPQLIIWGSQIDVESNNNWKHRLNSYWRNQHLVEWI